VSELRAVATGSEASRDVPRNTLCDQHITTQLEWLIPLLPLRVMTRPFAVLTLKLG
jgi:hypothetical protein